MNALEVKQLIKSERLVPILRASNTDYIYDITAALVDQNCKILEFTMTIDGIIKEICKIKEKFPNLTIGLGTVYNKRDAAEAIEAGVDFIVSPILNYDIVDAVKTRDRLLMISGFTPSEIYNAYKAGTDIVKLFPASEMSPTFIKELRGPMPFLEIFPTGGLTLISAIEFISSGAIAVGLGNSIFKSKLIEEKRYSEIGKTFSNAIRRIKNMAI